MIIRKLTESERDVAEAFLREHCDTSMFLRSNIRRAGLAYTGQAWTADYLAAFEGTRLAGLIAHCWNGMLLVQAPAHAEALARALAAQTGRDVTGFSGPRDQVARVRAALALADVQARLDADEDFYALPLDALREPPQAAEPVVCRRAQPRDRDVLVAWRFAYELETLSGTDGQSSRERATQFLDAQLQAGHGWVALVRDQLVSFSAFNAALPEIVQLGGIFTPSEHRGRSYAKHAIAAQLRAARADGVSRAVLFTKNPSAVRCYEALGFRHTGEFSLVLLH